MAERREVPRVSVVVAAYNVEQYIEQCIESLCSQTLHEIEIILVDDGSTDQTPAICERFAQMDERIRVIHKPNGGLVSARKAGAAVAKGQFIGCVDGDDFVEPEMYEALADAAEYSAASMAECQLFHYIQESGEKQENRGVLKQGVYDRDALRRVLYPTLLTERREPPSSCNKIYATELYRRHIGTISDRIVQGEDFCLTYPMLMEKDVRLAVVDRPLYDYRILKRSMSHGYRRGLIDSYTLLLEHVEAAVMQSAEPVLIGQMDVLRPSYMMSCVCNEMLPDAPRPYAASHSIVRQAALSCTPQQWRSLIQSDKGRPKTERLVAQLCESRNFALLDVLIRLKRVELTLREKKENRNND